MCIRSRYFPIVPTNAIRYGTSAGGTSLKQLFKRDITRPDSSQRPMPKGHGDYQTERCETGKVLYHIVKEPVGSVYREEVLGNNGFICCRVDQAHTSYRCDRTDDRREKEEPTEQDYRVGKFVTYVFNDC